MSDQVELLFFDTFSHDNSEELNLDLVQFTKPVYISEVRIIPLGARVQADFPGGVRLGATNPSQFNIEFFVNYLGKPGASTFESLGGFEYNQNGCIHLECSVADSSTRQIPTDGLVLRGWYTTITLAVYGTLTRVIAEQMTSTGQTPAIPPQPTPISTEPQILASAPPVEPTWPPQQPVDMTPVQMDYPQPATVSYGAPQSYQQPTEQQYAQEYHEYYGSDTPKDPRAYHPDSDWDRGETRRPSSEREHGRCERNFSRSHSGDRDAREYRDRDGEYETRHRDRSDGEYVRDKDWDRYGKHQDSYKRMREQSYDRDEPRKRPRTPPIVVSKRPRTPHGDAKDLSPGDVESISEEEIVGVTEPDSVKGEKETCDSIDGGTIDTKIDTDAKRRNANAMKVTPSNSPSAHTEDLLDVEQFEPILSDEEICDENEQFPDLDYDYSGYVNNDDLIKLFNPFTADLQQYLKPSLVSAIKDNLILKDDDDERRNEKEAELTAKINGFLSESGDNLRKVLDLIEPYAEKLNLVHFDELSDEMKECWVESIDKVPSLLTHDVGFGFILEIHTFLKSRDSKDINFVVTNQNYAEGVHVVESLIKSVEIGLNFEYALSQPQPGFKIRHIKCGIRLVESLCSHLGAVEILLKSGVDIHGALFTLYETEYMALSIKLMILRALDSTLRTKIGVDGFVSSGCYRKLLDVLRRNPSARAKFAINSLLNKLHLYEILSEIDEKVSTWYENRSLIDENEDRCAEIAEEEVETVGMLLDRVLKIYRDGPFSMTQPKRFLPVSAQFEISRERNVQHVTFRFFEIHNLLENFLMLILHRTCGNFSIATSGVFELLTEFLKHEDGLNYLTENVDVINVIVRCLLQSCSSEDDAQFSRAPYVGLCLSYKLQTVYHIDAIADLSKKHECDCNAPGILDHLHALYCLTFSNISKLAVAEVLSVPGRIEPLLSFIDAIDYEPKSENDALRLERLKKSPGVSYVIDLIATTVALAPDVLYLETYGKTLLRISNHSERFEPSTCAKLVDIGLYLKPLENLNVFTYEDITPLCEIVKKSIDDITKFPESLVTALRILHRLGVAPHEDARPSDTSAEYVELKYKHVILQLYSWDGIANLTMILSKICDHYEQPNLHTTTFVSNRGARIIATVYLCVRLVRRMLTEVILCRNTRFKDLTAVPILLRTYTLMFAFPPSSLLYFYARKVCKDVVETLLAYTQPVSDETSENESPNKSLWTLTVGEVVRFVTTAPYRFIPGLLIFSELLPLPFPIQTRVTLNDDEIQRTVNSRKLWSAHLHAQGSNIQELIDTLIASSYQPLLHLLRRVCIQLSDLAANTALTICRGILDTILCALMPKFDESEREPCSSHVARLLNFLASLMTHGAIKCAVAYLIRPNCSGAAKGDDKYPALIDLFCDILKFYDESNTHVQAQECVVSIVQSLCDSEITLTQSVEGKVDVSSDIYLSNALPPKDVLIAFVSAMIDHVTSTESGFTTILPIIRTLVLLTEHDYGFYHLRVSLEKKSQPLRTVFEKCCTNFSKDNADCLATLSAMLEFLKLCISVEYIEPEQVLMFTPRSTVMTTVEMRILLGYDLENNEKILSEVEVQKHPLLKLDELLKVTTVEDESLESMSETLSSMVQLLNGVASSQESKENLVEPILPPPEQLLIQFSSRPVFTLSSDVTDDRLSAMYWLSAPADEGETDIEQIPCDLSEVCRQLLPADVNLCRETEKICRVTRLGTPDQVSVDQLKVKRGVLDSGTYDLDKVNKRPFITPVRGRGFTRSVPQRGDPFRSRPPNTSRPPSLHVDDFVALETCGAQPTGPTGYNKLSREIMSVRGTSRGRGRTFVSPERGAHYRQIGRGTPIWPGAHLSEAIVSSAPQHFRIATDTPTHFSSIRGSSRGRGILRLRDTMPIRHIRTFPR